MTDTVTVAFCCNDDRGEFTGRVIEIDIPHEIHIACPHTRGFNMRRDGNVVQVGRTVLMTNGNWRDWFGNVFWGATVMDIDEARKLVAYLLHPHGWIVEEHACEGPFADLVRA